MCDSRTGIRLVVKSNKCKLAKHSILCILERAFGNLTILVKQPVQSFFFDLYQHNVTDLGLVTSCKSTRACIDTWWRVLYKFYVPKRTLGMSQSQPKSASIWCRFHVQNPSDANLSRAKLVPAIIAIAIQLSYLQVAQLSQIDRAAGWVSCGQKWKTIICRQYNHCDVIGLQSYQIRWNKAK